jgi:hypothetical protein
MISKLYKPIDEASEQSLERLNALAESDRFLAGLGFRCHEYKIDSAYPVVRDYSRAYYLMVSQEMWDQTEPADEKYFVGVVEDSVDQFRDFDNTEQTRRSQYCAEHMDDFGAYMRNRTAMAFKENKIFEYVPDGHSGDPPAGFLDEDSYSIFVNEIDAYFLRMILGSYFGGLEKWPVASHLLQCFESGGMPCGWVGPEFEDGGDPQACMQVLHFG